LREGTTVQERLQNEAHASDATLPRRFATMVFNNNFKGAMSLIAEKGKGGILPLNAGTLKSQSSVADLPVDAHPVLFSSLDGEMIKRCALRTNGGAGISQQDDKLWHKMVASFKDTSSDLCNAIARLSRRISTEMVDPNGLAALLANRGIAIDKNPGLRPVGVGEMLRRIIGKAIMK